MPEHQGVDRPSYLACMGYETNGKNARSGSTTWVPKVDKIRGRRPGGAAAPKAASRWSTLTKRNAREPITIQIKFRGGNEAWYFVQARGSSGAFPGYRSIHDVMREINEGTGFRSRDDEG